MNLSPKQIVAELDRYIIGQSQAKKSLLALVVLQDQNLVQTVNLMIC